MTIVKNRKDYEINGQKYFVEQYAEKPRFIWFWRYGYYRTYNGVEMAVIEKDLLRTRPNLKRLALAR